MQFCFFLFTIQLHPEMHALLHYLKEIEIHFFFFVSLVLKGNPTGPAKKISPCWEAPPAAEAAAAAAGFG